MNFMIIPGMLVSSSFLISVCIVLKALLISSATVIVRAGGDIWLNPFATVLFNVCSALTVECCVLDPCCVGVFVRKKGCCCLPTPMALASGGSPMFPLVVHQPASPSIWPAVQSLRRGLSTNPGATMWCVCGCS